MSRNLFLSFQKKCLDWRRSPVVETIKPILGVGAGIAIYYWGLDVMGFTPPPVFGLIAAIAGGLIVVLAPFYMECFSGWSKSLKILSSTITLVSLLAFPFLSRGPLDEISERDFRNLVAETIRSFEPNALIRLGGEVYASDGMRTVGLTVHGRDKLTVVDIINTPSGEKVGIESVEGIHSKSRDAGADFAMVFSSTGFDPPAIRRAKRLNVGLMTVLRQGDRRIKAVIEEEIYLLDVAFDKPLFTYTATTPEGRGVLSRNVDDENDLTYAGRNVDAWLEWQAVKILYLNPTVRKGVSQRLRATFNLREPVAFSANGAPVLLRNLSISFLPKLRWLSQTVQLDATLGIYDYVRGRVRLAPGSNSYTIRGVNFDEATPLDSAPEDEDLKSIGLLPGEVELGQLIRIDGVYTSDHWNNLPLLEPLMRPEDLDFRKPITGGG